MTATTKGNHRNENDDGSGVMDTIQSLLKLDPAEVAKSMDKNDALMSKLQDFVSQLQKPNLSNGGGDEDAEAKLRYDLAVAHRLVAKYGMDMLVWNHISARLSASGSGDCCLITPGRKMWSRMRPSDLVKSSTNVTADIIHQALYSARPDVKAIIHLHTPYATAVSCLPEGFRCYTQDSAYFYGTVANYDWDGVSNDEAEGPAIAAAVNAVPGCNTLLMKHHGFVCFGKSVKEVWVLAYYFERACQTQMELLKSNNSDCLPNKLVMEKAAQDSYLPEFSPGVCEWEALCEEVSFDN